MPGHCYLEQKQRFSPWRGIPLNGEIERGPVEEVQTLFQSRGGIKMENGQSKERRLPSIIHYSMIGWTIICFLGTWFVILRYGIVLEGLIAIMVTLFFAAAIWMVPLIGLILLSLYVTPLEESSRRIAFRELIKKGLRKSLE
jgi:hypothetical protein